MAWKDEKQKKKKISLFYSLVRTQLLSHVIPFTLQSIGHFRVPNTFSFKARLSTKPFLRKWVSIICMRIKKKCFHINEFALRLALKQWLQGLLGNGLVLYTFKSTLQRSFLGNYHYQIIHSCTYIFRARWSLRSTPRASQQFPTNFFEILGSKWIIFFISRLLN